MRGNRKVLVRRGYVYGIVREDFGVIKAPKQKPIFEELGLRKIL